MWKSVIREDHEEQDESGTGFNPLFLEWVEALKGEPWFVALRDLVKWTGTWTGTEEELMEEVRFRVDREAWEAEDFPSDFRKLMYYYKVLYRSLSGLNLDILDYRELSEDDLKEFDVPGWGPGAPILVDRDWAAVRPGYHQTMSKLVKYDDPLLLAFMIFTSSTEFAKSERRWSGWTDELARALRIYYPSPGDNCPVFFGEFRWASKEGPLAFYCHDCLDLLYTFELYGPSGYRRFYARMKTCAAILEEVGLKVRAKKVTRKGRDSEGMMKETKKTRWTVEAPNWRFPDRGPASRLPRAH